MDFEEVDRPKTSNIGPKIFVVLMIALIIIGVGLLIWGSVRWAKPKDDDDKGIGQGLTIAGGVLIGVPAFLLIMTFVVGV